MKIGVLSDLHLEFSTFDLQHKNIDVLVLAGDIHLGTKGIHWVKQQALEIPVLYVLGNHEYYRDAYPKLLNQMREMTAGTSIHVLEDESVCIEDVTFYGCTLWTDFELFGNARLAGYQCQQIMNDYKKIRRSPSFAKLRSIDTAIIHNQSIQWLKSIYHKSKNDKKVIITHHAPSLKSILDYYKSDISSAAYASHLDGLIKNLAPNIWIHGHIHEHLNYKIYKTQVVCNPRGYPNTDNQFNPSFTIEL